MRAPVFVYLLLCKGALNTVIKKTSLKTISDVTVNYKCLINLAGFPAYRVCGGTSVVTTLPAAIIAFFPKVTPAVIVVFAPIQTPSSTVMGLAVTRPWLRSATACG